MKFIQGEKKEVGIKVISRKNEPFTIRNATWEIKKWGTTLIESSGAAEIIDNEVNAVVQPIEKGLYTLTFTYEIAQETLKADVQVEVR